MLPNAHGVIGGGLAALMIAIAVVDARRFIIPDELTAAALALGFLHAGIQGADLIVEALASAALRGAVLALAFLSLRVLYRRIRGREGIGLGDVKLAGVAGVWLDWWMAPVAIEDRRAGSPRSLRHETFIQGPGLSARRVSMPFGLFFAPAIWLGWLLESTIFLIPCRDLRCNKLAGVRELDLSERCADQRLSARLRDFELGLTVGGLEHGEGCKAFHRRVGTLAFGRSMREQCRPFGGADQECPRVRMLPRRGRPNCRPRRGGPRRTPC